MSLNEKKHLCDMCAFKVGCPTNEYNKNKKYYIVSCRKYQKDDGREEIYKENEKRKMK